MNNLKLLIFSTLFGLVCYCFNFFIYFRYIYLRLLNLNFLLIKFYLYYCWYYYFGVLKKVYNNTIKKHFIYYFFGKLLYKISFIKYFNRLNDKIISLYSKDLNKKYFNIGLDVKFRKGGMIKNRCFSTCCINNFNHSKPILNKDVNFKDNNLNINLDSISSNKYPLTDINSLYTFGLKNNDVINNDPKFKEIMNILKRRVIDSSSSNKVKFEDGYIEVGEFKNILLLDDNIENLNNNKQDIELNDEYGVYDMLTYKNEFEKILNSLNENRVYKMVFKFNLCSVDYNGKEIRENKTSPSFFISRGTSIDYLLFKFKSYLSEILIKYDIPDITNLSIFIKEWIDTSDFKNVSEIYSILSKKEKEILDKQSELKNVEVDKNIKSLFKILKQNYLGIGNGKFNFNNPSLLVKGLKYGNKILNVSELNFYKKLIFNLDSYSNIDSITDNDLNNKNVDNINFIDDIRELKDNYYKLNYGTKGKYYILKVSNVDDINNQVKSYIEIIENSKIRLELVEEWIDTIQSIQDRLNNSCIRILKNSSHKLIFNRGRIENIELQYNCKSLQESSFDLDKNLKLGSFDLETYLDKDNNVIPYYIGCRTGNIRKFYKYSDYLSYDDMILKFIEDLMVPENHNRYYYALNMSNFDGIIVLKSLIKTSHKHDFKIKTFSKNDGTILSVAITRKLKNNKSIRIVLADSFHLLPFSLLNLAKVFNNSNDNMLLKGNYPHDFINSVGLEKGLSYKGDVPDKIYFNNISVDDYNEIVNRINKLDNGIWNSEKELLDYLKKDIDILYLIMVKFGDIVYNYFNINITRVRTYSGLAFLIYCSKYYNTKKNIIYLTSGKIDRYIRNAYYGGIVENFVNYLDKPAYKYDINSHYPNQMRNNPMPGGKPRFSTQTNLDLIFGFVNAKVIAPNEDELKVPILPINKNGELVTFRGSAEGTWFSEELKYAQTLGYKIIVKDCIIFDKVYGLFDDFVNDLYNLKSQAELEKNMVLRLVFKLILNSLYGRWGLKDLGQEYKIIENSKLDKLNKIEDIDILFGSEKFSFVKSQGPVYPEIVELFVKENLISQEKSKFNEPKPWGKNISAVQLSAAITAYSRVYLNQFKNIPDNNYLGGDTDSFILEKPLASDKVGKGLGQAKLEYTIKEGFFHSKKSYLVITDKNETIIKMKGINNNNYKLNYFNFVKLFSGLDVNFTQLQFSKDYKNMDIKIIPIVKTIKGIKDENLNNFIKIKYKNLLFKLKDS